MHLSPVRLHATLACRADLSAALTPRLSAAMKGEMHWANLQIWLFGEAVHE